MTSSVVVDDGSGEKYEEVEMGENDEPYNPEVRNDYSNNFVGKTF